MKSAIVGGGCWGAILAFVAYHAIQAYRIDRRAHRRRVEAHKARVREYEFLRHTARVRYPLAEVPNRIPNKHLGTCKRIWAATVAQEQQDREEWKRAAT